MALPFSDHCPLLAEDEDNANALIDRAIRLAQQQRAKYLELGAHLRSLVGHTAFSVFNWRDPLPALGDFTTVFSRAMRGFHRKGRRA